MRIQKNFGQRTLTKPSDEARKKYFLAFEGSETEVQYFNGIIENIVEMGFNPLIEIIPLLRSYNKRNWSNPKKILNRIVEYIDECNSNIRTVDLLISRTIDYLIEESLIPLNSVNGAEKIYKFLIKSLTMIDENGCKKNDNVLLDEICNQSKEKANIIIEENVLYAYLDSQKISYEEGLDKICLIVDRDKQSFVSLPGNDQYNFVKNICSEKGFGFYLTNPCFEFWLLLHFDCVHTIDKIKLLENPNVTKKRRFIEDELKKILIGYKKNDVKFDLLKERIEKAIQNEESFCEDINLLKDQLGCNIGLLIKELKE